MGERSNQLVQFTQFDEIKDRNCYLILVKLTLILYAVGYVEFDPGARKTEQNKILVNLAKQLDGVDDPKKKLDLIHDLYDLIIIDENNQLIKAEVVEKTQIHSTRGDGYEWWWYREVNSYYDESDFTIDEEVLMDQGNYMMEYYGRKYGLYWSSSGREIADRLQVRLFHPNVDEYDRSVSLFSR